MYSIIEALALFLKLDLTEAQYQMMRTGAVDQGADIYPPLYQIQEEKKKCVPIGIENPSPGEYLVSIQNCVHHHLTRLMEDDGEFREVIERYGRDPNNKVFYRYFYIQFTLDEKSRFFPHKIKVTKIPISRIFHGFKNL